MTAQSASCAYCDGPLSGKQTRFCSSKCGKLYASRERYRREKTEQRARLSKVQRLAIAAAVAPEMRRAPSSRKVTVVDADGKPVRVTTLAEVQLGVLKRAAIELSVDPGRAGSVFCEVCSKPFEPKSAKQPPKRCVECKHGRCGDCNEPLLSAKTERAALRRGEKPRCRKCSAKVKGSKLSKSHRCMKCGAPVSPKAAEGQRYLERRGKTPGCRACFDHDPKRYESWWKAGIAARQKLHPHCTVGRGSDTTGCRVSREAVDQKVNSHRSAS